MAGADEAAGTAASGPLGAGAPAASVPFGVGAGGAVGAGSASTAGRYCEGGTTASLARSSVASGSESSESGAGGGASGLWVMLNFSSKV